MQAQGLTLLELLITLSILITLLALGIPGLSQMIDKNRLKVAALDLLEATEMARTQAAAINARATVRNRGSWEAGWEIFVDSDNNGIRAQSEKLISDHEPINHLRITPNRWLKNYVSYIGTGEARLVGKWNAGAMLLGKIYICGLDEGPGYGLVLSRSGRVRMEQITSAQCAAGPSD